MTRNDAAVEFLRALGRYLSVHRLYDADHPTIRKAVERVHETATELLAREPRSSFSFLPGRVIHRDLPVRELDDWPWAERLAGTGIQRLELSRGLRPDETREFLGELAGILLGEDELAGAGEPVEAGPPGEEEGGDTGEDEAEGRAWPHVRFGTLGIEADRLDQEGNVFLEEEAEAVGWIHEMAEREGRVPVEETLALVQSLSLSMRGARQLIVPFVRLKETDQYTAAHCINVSILSMSLADALDFPQAEVRAVGAAGLLHDVGKMEVPSEILNKPGRLNEREWEAVKEHPVAGARILLESGPELELPAVVAFEHHVGWQGGGYPDLHYDRKPLPVSRLVQVCDFYDALRTRRHYRKPMMAAEVLRILRRNEGDELDPQFVDPFVSLVERWDPASVMVEIRPEEEATDTEGAGTAAGEGGEGAGADGRRAGAAAGDGEPDLSDTRPEDLP